MFNYEIHDKIHRRLCNCKDREPVDASKF